MAPAAHPSNGDSTRGLDTAESRTWQDPRVAAVLEVLGGAASDEVAARWAVDQAVLDRWVAVFVEAGTAQVLNRPDAQALAHRERFLAAFTMEMRTPLAVAMGWSDLLAAGDLAPRSFLRTAERLQESLTTLGDRLIDVELLVAAAMGGLRIERRDVCARDVLALPGMEVIGGSGPDTRLHVDPELFTRVVADLWEASALEPAPRARRVEVQVIEPWVEVRVVREAEPIDPDVLKAIFEPFASDNLHSGVAIGLYLARALTVAHGGTIGLDQDDRQAVIWVRVPRRPPPPAQVRPIEPVAAHDNGGAR
ncbi:HAMP domain-containing sensor histidine kinase [Nocardioides sp.]|uniref:sensor histidine kinase n=1 Tax=Nocardioides sp. TaxID=35761 RepID=UPI002B271337|nr:HAMP domain-containing sensor histidine kinase [Nocardioides sp.]